MSLRVDLILPSERRSASVINARSLTRLSAVVVPLVLLLLGGQIFMGMMKKQAELSGLEERWFRDEPRQNRAIELTKTVNRNREIQEELAGWRRSRMNWSDQLAELPKWTPKTIQLQSLTISHVLQLIDDRDRARAFTLRIHGKATGPNADQDFDALQHSLETAALFAESIETVDVVDFDADRSMDAVESDRVFRIRCDYNPVRFDEATRRPKRAR
jgi:hypothetical protein